MTPDCIHYKLFPHSAIRNNYFWVANNKMGFSLHKLLFIWLSFICTLLKALCRQTTFFFFHIVYNLFECYKLWIMANQHLWSRCSTRNTGNHHAKITCSAVSLGISPKMFGIDTGTAYYLLETTLLLPSLPSRQMHRPTLSVFVWLHFFQVPTPSCCQQPRLLLL